MQAYEVPIGAKYRPALEILVAQLAAGQFGELVRTGQMAPHAVEPIAMLIKEAGRNLVALPTIWWQIEGAITFPVHEPSEWCAILPLPTQDRSLGRTLVRGRAV